MAPTENESHWSFYIDTLYIGNTAPSWLLATTNCGPIQLSEMSPEVGCLNCGIATIWSSARNTDPHAKATRPGEYLFLDIHQPLLSAGLTPTTSYAFYFQIVDAFSRFTRMYEIANKSTALVIRT